MLEVDEMQEALEQGLLNGKLVNPLTIKFNDAVMEKMDIVCAGHLTSAPEWIREIVIRELLAEEAKFNRMAKAREKARITSDTLENHKKSPVATNN